MPQISKRLSVDGPDTDGDYYLQLEECGGGDIAYHFITRAEADALIAALQPPQPQAPADTMRAHLDTFGK